MTEEIPSTPAASSTTPSGSVPSGHVTPEVAGHATHELKQAMEAAERIVASTDVHSKHGDQAANAPVPPPSTSYPAVAPMATAKPAGARVLDADEELRYAARIIVGEVRRRIVALAKGLTTVTGGRGYIAPLLAGLAGFIIASRMRAAR